MHWGDSCLHWRFNLAHGAEKVAEPARPFSMPLADFSFKANPELKLINDNLVDLIFKAWYFVYC